jgi:malonyl-CoA O-methyltransferase
MNLQDPMNDNPFENSPIDKRKVRRNFENAVATYDEVAVLQREVGDRLLEQLEPITVTPQRILDLGCGTGNALRKLTARYPKAEIVAVDLAPGMLKQARSQRNLREKFLRKQQRFVCGDAESLPFADDSFDFIWSNLALQWCEPLDKTFSELFRVLQPEGLLIFSTLGPDTLRELKSSWRNVDNYPHVNDFIDMHDVGDALVRNRFSDPVMNAEYITLTYSSVRNLMQDLKKLGSKNASRQRRKGLLTKHKLQQLEQQYEKFRQDDVLPASYEVVYGHAWVTAKAKTTSVAHDGVATIPLNRIARRR